MCKGLVSSNVRQMSLISNSRNPLQFNLMKPMSFVYWQKHWQSILRSYFWMQPFSFEQMRQDGDLDPNFLNGPIELLVTYLAFLEVKRQKANLYYYCCCCFGIWGTENQTQLSCMKRRVFYLLYYYSSPISLLLQSIQKQSNCNVIKNYLKIGIMSQVHRKGCGLKVIIKGKNKL